MDKHSYRRRNFLKKMTALSAAGVAGLSSRPAHAAYDPAAKIGLGYYFGPWTPPATGMHHYTFTLIATDLDPKELPAGLTRDELFAKLQGHTKGAAGLVGLFGRAAN